ncbi:MAG: hypothetical protein ABL912_00660 [Novosphingobium sp.]
MLSLQTTFASAAGEAAWEAHLRALFERRELGEAERLLRTALVASGGAMMQLCRAASLSCIQIVGWEDLAAAVAHHKGERITGATVAMGNEANLSLEAGETHRPYMVLGLYTDQAWNWSAASAEAAMEQCHAESPAWAGWAEELGAILEIEGLDALNTALIDHKQRDFVRENKETPVPLGYVEFVLGCWWRALRFHQAVAVQLDQLRLGGSIPVISGLINMRPEVVSLHWPGERKAPERPPVVQGAAENAAPVLARLNQSQLAETLTDEDTGPAGNLLRRRFGAAGAIAGSARSGRGPGLVRRMFGRS